MTSKNVNPDQAVIDAGERLERRLAESGWIVSQEALRGLPQGTVILSPHTGVLERIEQADWWLSVGSTDRMRSHNIALPCQVLTPSPHMDTLSRNAENGDEVLRFRLVKWIEQALAAPGAVTPRDLMSLREWAKAHDGSEPPEPLGRLVLDD